MNNVLIFGSGGQLGQALKSVVSLTESSNFEYIFLSKQDSDITNSILLEDVFKKHTPKYIINCAAYTQVDLAEDFKEEAHKINVIGAKNLASLCHKYKCCLLHISTDFVFQGNISNMLNEEDPCNPINYYGLSKLQGEQEIEKLADAYFILRTSWLYSEFGNNFMKTMLRLGKEKDRLQVVNDQFGTPTYAVDLAKALLQIIETKNQKFGVYHYSNEGASTWYDFAKAIFEYTNISIEVTPVGSSEFVTKANRPSFSVLDKAKIKTNIGLNVPYWRDSLNECLQKIN